MKNFSDIIIIGAGPAGLSAAVTASNLGLDVLVLDEQPSLGGQIYRNIERAGKQERKILGADYEKGRLLIEKFKESRAEYIGNAIVWRIDLDGNVCFSHENKSRQINGKHIIIATGAMERPVPFPGWTLPGVMGAGAVDANFKSSGMIPDGPVVLAGSGPLLLLSAGHLMDLGVNIHAILDTTPIQNYVAAAPHLPRALKRLDTLFKGLGMLMNIKRSKVPVYKGVTQYMAQGRDCLKRISFKTKSRTRQMDAGMLLVQEGVIPRCDFTRQLGLKHLWNPVQRYFYPGTNVFGKSQVDTIYVAGDGAFVHGGIPSALKGSLAALDIAEKLNALPQAQKATQIAKR
ncbi:MAG: FAD-dependent oxidoreductase, partial [Desulfobacteraceae bacterium]|nr:FAD-dependent oxidoreductase [Desulfobacteraceae bacterium]